MFILYIYFTAIDFVISRSGEDPQNILRIFSEMKLEKFNLMIIDNLFDGVYFVDTERRITYWNKAAESITGYRAEEIIGQYCQSNILNHIDSDGRALCMLGCPLFATIIDGRQRADQVFLQHKEGHRIPVQINILPIIEDAVIVGAVEIFRISSFEINENRIIKKPLEAPLNDDFTTNTNREKTESYLTYRLHELKSFQRKFCVILLSIDDISKLSNAYGPDIGKKLLDRVYKSISYNIRPYDFFSYFHNEEFIGVFEIKKNYEATLLAEKIRILVAGSDIHHELGNLSATASLGVTAARENDTVGTIIQRAGSLLRQSKQKDNNSISSDA